MSYTTALITGASSGMGRGLALALAKRGTKVYAAARRRPELESLAKEAPGIEILELDVADADHTEAVIREIDQSDPLDLVVANAGIGIFTPGDRLVWKDAQKVLQVNVMGAIATLCAAAPGMVERGRGHLAGVSSLAAFRGLPQNAAYSASKAALSMFLESIRLDLAGTGVDVTAICPGFVRTPMTEGLGKLPFIVDLDRAVDIIVAGLDAKEAVCAFPTVQAFPMRALGLLPPTVYDFVGQRLKRFIPER